MSILSMSIIRREFRYNGKVGLIGRMIYRAYDLSGKNLLPRGHWQMT